MRKTSSKVVLPELLITMWLSVLCRPIWKLYTKELTKGYEEVTCFHVALKIRSFSFDLLRDDHIKLWYFKLFKPTNTKRKTTHENSTEQSWDSTYIGQQQTKYASLQLKQQKNFILENHKRSTNWSHGQIPFPAMFKKHIVSAPRKKLVHSCNSIYIVHY